MNLFIRIGVFIFLCVMSIVSPFLLFLFCAFLYIFLWSGVELLIIGICIDGLFGTTSTSFLYTLSLGTLLFVGELLRPYLSWYTTRT
jgi:hypothetical protein